MTKNSIYSQKLIICIGVFLLIFLLREIFTFLGFIPLKYILTPMVMVSLVGVLALIPTKFLSYLESPALDLPTFS
jgi:hypothetical protein